MQRTICYMVAIVTGHDDIENCVRLDEVDPTCMFIRYGAYIQQEWHGYESRVMTGDRKYKVIGRPWVKLIFPYLTNLEWLYFASTLANGAQSVDVTVYLVNKDLRENHYYNGTLHINESEPNTYEWGERYNIEFEIRDLVEIG